MALVATTTTVPFIRHDIIVVIPHATNEYSPPLRALYVGGAAGDIAVTSHQGATDTSATHSGVPAGGIVQGKGDITRVLATGTTATGIVGIR